MTSGLLKRFVRRLNLLDSSSIGTNFTFFRILDRGRKLDFGIRFIE
jgi:hypothetical protein